ATRNTLQSYELPRLNKTLIVARHQRLGMPVRTACLWRRVLFGGYRMSVWLFSGGLGCCSLFEQLLFAVDEGVDVVRGEFESMAVRDRIGGAGFHAIAAEDATRV